MSSYYFGLKILMVFTIYFITQVGLISRSLAQTNLCNNQRQIEELLEKSQKERTENPSDFKRVVECGKESVSALSRIIEQNQKFIETNKKEIETLQGKVLISQSAISALKKIGPNANEAVPVLIKALEYPFRKEVRSAAQDALTRIALDPHSIDQLLIVLPKQADQGKEVRWRTVDILGRILREEKDLEPDLVNKIIDDLVDRLKTEQEDEDVLWAVAGALGRAAEGKQISLHKGQEIVPLLMDMLIDSNLHPGAQGAAAQALGKIGLKTNTVLPEIRRKVSTTQKGSSFCKYGGIEALAIYAQVIARDSNKFNEINMGLREISKIEKALEQSECTAQKNKYALDIEQARGILENNRYTVMRKLIKTYEKFLWVVGGFIVYFFINCGLLWLRPLWLLKITNFLKDHELKIDLGPIKAISLSCLVLFKYHPRVLDAWVVSHIKTARLKLEGKETLSEHDIRISVPVCLRLSQKHQKFNKINNLTIEHLQRIFAERKICLLIWGVGGSGKTNLACQIARWLINRENISCLNKHLMIPVLIEEELAPAQDSNPLLESISGQLQYLIDEPKTISEDLLLQLLRQQRILVIVDHLSEMESYTREIITPQSRDFPINALIVTSRNQEQFEGVVDAEIKIPQINGRYLSDFIYDYVEERKQIELFKDKELFDACSLLSTIALSREKITIFLAKLYAEQLINSKLIGLAMEPDTSCPKPNNIPELILNYLEKLNQKVERQYNAEYPEVQEYAKLIAWKCLEQSYKPQPVMRQVLVDALGENTAEVYLKYLEQKLHLIHSIGVNQNQIKFVIDPIAEYLAGLYLVEKYCYNNQVRWRGFLNKANSKPSTEIIGFVSAVRECCLVKKATISVPDFVLDELSLLLEPLSAVRKQKQANNINNKHLVTSQ